MIVLSLFNGMNTGRIALENVGIKVDKYYSSEIKPYAIKLTQHHHPDTIQLGDVTKWKEWDINWTEIDLVLSGSPCQDLSIAGKRAGLKGKNSSLFWVFIEILNHIKSLNPNVLFLQENVGSAPKPDVLIMSKALGYATTITPKCPHCGKSDCLEIIEIEDTVVLYPCLINSNILTAQNRLRYYWTNIKTRTDWTGDVFTDIPQPEDKKIFLKDIIESGEVEEDKSKPLLEKTALAYQFKDQIKQQNYFKKRKEFGIITFVKEATKKGYLEIRPGDSVDLAYPESKTRRGRLMTDKSNALLRQNEFYYNTGEYLRLFTQTELERLQGFPDGWTSILSYNHASSLLGDGWTLPVIEHIFSFINTKPNRP